MKNRLMSVSDGFIVKIATNPSLLHFCKESIAKTFLRRNVRRYFIDENDSSQIFATEIQIRRQICDKMLFRRNFLRGKFIWSQFLSQNNFFCDEKSFLAIFCEEFVAKKSNRLSSSFCDEFVAIFASKFFRRKKLVVKRSFSCRESCSPSFLA